MTPSPAAAGFSVDRLRRIDALLQGYVDRDEIAGMVGTIARKGQTAYFQKFGWMDREARLPMRDDTIFMIMSMTKPITSVALMMLYDEGAFHLNMPIATFLPEFKDTRVFVRDVDGKLELEDLKGPITFRHLFTHTAGLSYGWNPLDPIDKAYQADPVLRTFFDLGSTNREVCAALARQPLAFQPGTRWRYSMAVDVLGGLVEVISGAPLDVFLEERLFKPLGMTDTAFHVPAEKAARVATVYGHPAPDSALVRRDQIKPRTAPPVTKSGGGGLASTIFDYSRFAQMLVNGGVLDGARILSPRTVALFSRNQTPAAALPYGFVERDLYHAGYGYSLGTRVLMDPAASGIDGSVGEFGWDGAFATYFWVDPVESLYGVLLLQHEPNAFYPIHQQFKQLTYQALDV